MALGTMSLRGAAKPQAKRVFSLLPTCSCIVSGESPVQIIVCAATVTRLADGDGDGGVSRAGSAGRFRSGSSIAVVIGCAPPEHAPRGPLAASSSVVTASRKSSSVAPGLVQIDTASVLGTAFPDEPSRSS